jgi:hypothetical protein
VTRILSILTSIRLQNRQLKESRAIQCMGRGINIAELIDGQHYKVLIMMISSELREEKAARLRIA